MLAEEAESTFNFNLEARKVKLKLKTYLNRFSSEETLSVRSTVSYTAKTGVKLPKLTLKKFCGDPLCWQQFYDSFEAAVNMNDSISDVEKFTYLRSYVEGEAEKCIEGISLTNKNYKHALKLLSERYGNPQLITSSHMSKLLKLKSNSR